MQVIHERCAALDVPKKTVVTTIMITQADGSVQEYVRTFLTMTADLLALDDWLRSHRVEVIAMESTGVFTPPPMVPIGGGIVRRGRKRGRTEAEDDADLLSIHLNPFDQGTYDLPARLKICLVQPILHSGSKRFQTAHNQTHLLFHL